MIHSIRQVSHQLINPQFSNPKELIQWMGAVQAQEYNMVKWAIGMRLKKGTLQVVEEAINKGEILRSHVLRPTWHLVPAEDLRWMVQLSAQRNNSAYKSYARQIGISPEVADQYMEIIAGILQGNNHLTQQEIKDELNKKGFQVDISQTTWSLGRGEAEGLFCSGIDKNKKPTYALLDERVLHSNNPVKEEALATLAFRYFQSHSPATLEDFVWWSGLSVKEAREGISLIKDQLISDRYPSGNLLIHESYNKRNSCKEILHLLPSYDEYLISYKDRTGVLPKEHYPKAFNNYGIFQRVVLHKGKIIGNWKTNKTTKETKIQLSFFEETDIDPAQIEAAGKRYKKFLGIK